MAAHRAAVSWVKAAVCTLVVACALHCDATGGLTAATSASHPTATPGPQLAAPSRKAFSLTHVTYAQGDPLGQVLAIASLAPVFIVVMFVTLIASRRDMRTMMFFAGQLADEGVNFVLKRAIDQPRPGGTPDTSAHSSGMPSNHSQFMGFFAGYAGLFLLLR